MDDSGRRAGATGVSAGERVKAEPITLAQLAEVLHKEIAWMRIYFDYRHEQSLDCMDWEKIRDAVRAYGDRYVRRVYPGYRFVMIYLE